MSDKHFKAARKETRRFLTAGAVATFFDYTIFNILVGIFQVPIIAANIASTSFGTIISYTLNRKIVFDGDRHDSRRKSVFLYIAIIATGIYGIQTLVIYLVHMQFPELGQTVHDVLVSVGIDNVSERVAMTNTAKVCASVVSAIWNFTMLRRFVFVPLTHNPEKHVD